LYWAGVAQADRDVGLVLDSLREAGALDDTLVIVTADHGEELGEHGVWEHDWMWQTNQRVPLVMRWPARLPAGKRVGALVESIDILPTVGALLGLDAPWSAPGAGADVQIDGRSLVPLVDGELEAVREHAFCENGVYISIQDLGWKLVARHEDLAPDAWPGALAREPHRRPELYDLASDPGETQNLVLDKAQAAHVERLLAALRAHDAAMPIPLMDVARSARDLEHEENLEALGYAGGGDAGDGREKPAPVSPEPHE
jgi:arylsulfatase A-like enzyme